MNTPSNKTPRVFRYAPITMSRTSEGIITMMLVTICSTSSSAPPR